MKARGQPTILAAEHYYLGDEKIPERVIENTRVSKELFSLFAAMQKHGIKGTLYIEGPPSNYVGKTDKKDPYQRTAAVAKRYGWKIVPLDRNAFDAFAYDSKNGNERHHERYQKDPVYAAYVNRNMREKYWARTIQRNKAGPHDMILMHPLHVKGFLIEAGWRHHNIRWISQKPGKTDRDRLGSKARRQFTRQRARERTTRVKTIRTRARPR